MDTIRQTKLVIDRDKFRSNLETIQQFVGQEVEVMPVIKARGYGTGVGTLIDIYEDLKIKILAVAVVDEAVALRKRGYQGEIFVLNQPFVEEIAHIVAYDISVGVCVREFMIKLEQEAKKQEKQMKVHLEIDTGMGRTGIRKDEVVSYMELLKKFEYVKLDGVYTHFSSSDSDLAYTKQQIDLLDTCVETIKQQFSLTYIHACNTGGMLNFPQAHYNLVRPGISIYGHYPDEKLKEILPLKPAIQLVSKVVFMKEVEPGTSISYNRSYKTTKKMKVATIPIGYADGLMRCYQGDVVINKTRAKILGVINMDNIMVDVSHIEDVTIGTDVFIWDNDILTVEEIAKKCNTISYEILSRLAPRVRKEFK